MKNYFVTKRSNGWAVKKSGASRASKLFPTQSKAINYGRGLAKSSKSELTIQGRDNKFRTGWSYGNDPFPPKG